LIAKKLNDCGRLCNFGQFWHSIRTRFGPVSQRTLHCWADFRRSASSRCSKPTIRSSAYRKTMTIEKFAFPSASGVQCRDRRRLDPSMRIVPGTDCAALRYETKSPRPVPGALDRAEGLLLTGWPGGWLRH
jgi:hypothetical protein